MYSTVTKKRSSLSGTVKRLISCVNQLVKINSMCIKVPTCKESPVTFVADVIICFACADMEKTNSMNSTELNKKKDFPPNFQIFLPNLDS